MVEKRSAAVEIGSKHFSGEFARICNLSLFPSTEKVEQTDSVPSKGFTAKMHGQPHEAAPGRGRLRCDYRMSIFRTRPSANTIFPNWFPEKPTAAPFLAGARVIVTWSPV